MAENAGSRAKPVRLADALAVIDAARQRAEAIGVPMNIAVVDEGTNLVAFARMDGAWLGSIDIAQDKAYTARAFNISTKELAHMSQPGEPLFGIHASHRGGVVIFAGGIPLKAKDEVVGAVGVSGGTPDQDHEVAEVGAAAFWPGDGPSWSSRDSSKPRDASEGLTPSGARHRQGEDPRDTSECNS